LRLQKNIFNEFTKRYQVKKFGIEYRFPKWLEEGDYALHIYGHSLDITDIDTLTIIFESRCVNKIIIWHMEKENKIAKLKATISNDLFAAIENKIELRII